MIAPVPEQDIHAGREAFQRDLKEVLGDDTLIARGWSQPDDLTLLVPMIAENPQSGQADFYLLRLVFDHYPKGPPSAQFINPITMTYVHTSDRPWLPKCEGAQDIHFHPNYNDSGRQLICSSTTLEFYKVNHDVKAEHVWTEQMNFKVTLSAIRRGLAPPFYKGRWEP